MNDYSLEQFRVFLAVVEHGGFAAAARHLNKAQSVVTYSIRQLEEQTGLILFDRQYYRPKLTNAGQALIPRARQLINDLEDFDQQAKQYAHGVEAIISIVINVFADLDQCLTAIKAMNQAFPLVKANLRLKPLGEDLELIRSGVAQLGIIPEIHAFGNEFIAMHIANHQLIAVAAHNHPLTSLAIPIDPAQLTHHTQIVWRDTANTLSEKDLGVHSLNTWHVDSLEVKRRLLINGLGWGSMPQHLVQDDIEVGRLQTLTIAHWEGRDRMPSYATSIVRLKKSVLGPAAQYFINHLQENP